MKDMNDGDQHDLDQITRRFKRVRHFIDVLIVLTVMWILGRAMSPKLAEATGKVSAILMTAALVILWVVHWHSLRKTRVEDIERIRFLTTHDGLTKAYNVRYLKQRIDEEILRAKRYDHSFCLFYMDLDRFKEVNDTFGHSAGDAVLVAVADLLQDTCRVTDMVGRAVGRIGGDEFLVLTPETGPEGGGCLGYRIVDAIEKLSVDVGDGRKVDFLGISIGVATFPADGADGAALLGKADAAMYRAKKAGGNCFSDNSGGIFKSSESVTTEAAS